MLRVLNIILKATRSIIENFMDKNMAPLQRIEEACMVCIVFFFVVFFAIGDDGYYPKKSTTLKISLSATTLIYALSLMPMDYLPEYSSTYYAP